MRLTGLPPIRWVRICVFADQALIGQVGVKSQHEGYGSHTFKALSSATWR